ncbi:hypothetical protein [Corynebacterium qintianiae]|uniref:hypothetical protein n=1 Tax=Corynebacterium qintianiae TaxID=2709392 RepID=UPI0013EB8600|nr:hypothetical protein [Corynebacterium qintianiae]
MAMNLSIDLDNGTFADLAALVEAARVAGVDKRAALKLDGTTLTLKVDAAAAVPSRTKPAARESGTAPLGDAAIRSVIDILSGRLEPPR